MSSVLLKILDRLRRSYTYRKKIDLHNIFAHTFSPDFTGNAASEQIFSLLNKKEPAMVARFGSVELRILNNYLDLQRDKASQYLNYIKGEQIFFEWEDSIFDYNFFLFSKKNESRKALIRRYSELYKQDIKQLDILGSWLEEEKKLKKYYPETLKTVFLLDIEPYYHNNPWSKVLQGKKVLVVHPFEQSIYNQYKKRELLFKDKNVLPEFELEVINTFHTFSGINQDQFQDWFEVLEHIKGQMDSADYDVAIIGCGPYGFHLAAHAKRNGKQGIHMGGATQLLFGIIGKRWEEPDYKNFAEDFFNENWSRPLPSESPEAQVKKSLDKETYW